MKSFYLLHACGVLLVGFTLYTQIGSVSLPFPLDLLQHFYSMSLYPSCKAQFVFYLMLTTSLGSLQLDREGANCHSQMKMFVFSLNVWRAITSKSFQIQVHVALELSRPFFFFYKYFINISLLFFFNFPQNMFCLSCLFPGEFRV